jgi:YgiT-type zinc finger domain-containing protein
MKCPSCLGERFTPGLYSIAQLYKEHPIVIQNVSAAKCEQCGHLLIDSSTSKEIEHALENLPDTSVAALVYDLASPARKPNVSRTAPIDTQVINNFAVAGGSA